MILCAEAQQSGTKSTRRGGKTLDQSLAHLPTGLKLQEKGPQKYSFVCDYYTLNQVGSVLFKDRIDGTYTRGLPEGKSRWNDVRISHATGLNDSFNEGVAQPYMEGFTYKLATGHEWESKDFFAGFPTTDLKGQNLVWDTYMFESFARNNFDKLALNKPYRFDHGSDVSLSGSGNFKNNNVELTWTGISKYNGVPCALIRYEAFFNTLNVAVPGFEGKGRSHYWGEIWVSLQTKQVEYGTLREDVLMEATIGGQPNKTEINVFRTGTLSKLVK